VCVGTGSELACVLQSTAEEIACVGTGSEVACVVQSTAEEIACVGAGSEVACVLPEDAPLAQPEDLASPLSAALLVLPFFLWGTSMVALKEVLPDTSPLFVAAMRLLPSGALLVAWARWRGRRQPQGVVAWGAVALFGLVDGTLFQGCLAEGLSRTSAGLGSVVIDSQPLTVALLAALFFSEPMAPLGVLGLLLGVLGLLVLELPGGSLAPLLASDASLWARGEWWMLLAAQAMAVGTCFVRVVVSLGVDPVMATGWHMLLGGVPLLALSLAREPQLYAHLGAAGLGHQDVALLAYSSLLGGAVAYGLFFRAASQGSLVRLSSLTFLTPVFAAVAGFAFLGETLTPQQLGGAAITLLGVALVNAKAQQAAG